jgi:hypothetical protein
MPGTPVKTSLAMRPQIARNLSSDQTSNLAGAKHSRRRLSSLPITTTAAAPTHETGEDPASPGPAESSTSSSSSSSPVESRIIRRPPRFHPQDGAGSFADDDEAEPAFLPFKAQSPGSSRSGGTLDLASTLRGDPRDFGRRLNQGSSKDRVHLSHTSDSSNSSAAVISRRQPSDRVPGPLSPRRTAELAGRGSGGKGKGYSRDGSDGTPSMGSSFSDLDGKTIVHSDFDLCLANWIYPPDASVTQSALEEALASKMQDGGTIGSRMSTLSQALRSRYLPKGSRP